jgi:hypothetical protein
MRGADVRAAGFAFIEARIAKCDERRSLRFHKSGVLASSEDGQLFFTESRVRSTYEPAFFVKAASVLALMYHAVLF